MLFGVKLPHILVVSKPTTKKDWLHKALTLWGMSRCRCRLIVDVEYWSKNDDQCSDRAAGDNDASSTSS